MKPAQVLFLVATQLTVVLSPAAAAEPAAPPPTVAVQKRLQSFRQARVLVENDWLLVQAPVATPEGLRFDRVIDPPSSTLGDPTTLSWERIGGIEVRVSGAGWGAITGGLIVGTALGIVAGAVSSEAGMFPSYEVHPGAVVVGATLGFAAGAVVGAAVGSYIDRWSRVYP